MALDSVGSGEGDYRGVGEPIESIEGIVAAHDVSDHKKSWADRITEKVNLGHFDSRDSIEENNTEEDSGMSQEFSVSFIAGLI
ncbi:hypothetical protein V6N11_008324 [Hibiscus sabdariffa]|uniref:Uncharacterized protein n=1 Tax=Hibiscus sabdariffa TaxID=183260 RepID=A0ABR2Q0A6_9ROSI